MVDIFLLNGDPLLDSSVRDYIVSVGSYFFNDTLLNKIHDSQIKPGFSKESIAYIVQYVYDSAIDYIQISEEVIDFPSIPAEVAEKMHANAVARVGDVSLKKLQETLNDSISFDAGYDIDTFIKDALFSDIFTRALVDAFISMGHSVEQFISNAGLPPDTPETAAFREKINIKLKEFMYGAEHVG
jgi:hypothetical protein